MKRGIARTFQINQLFGAMTPLEMIALVVSERLGEGGRPLARLDASPRLVEETADILARFRLDDIMDERISTLPYGKQRQIEIAAAFAAKPSVLLLDEPAAGVPEAERRELLDLVASLPEDVSVLLIEHDMDLVFRFATRITVLVNGRVLAEGEPAEVARDPAVKAAYLGEGAMVDAPFLADAPLLSLTRLSAGYGEAAVLFDVDLTLAEGRSLALLGRNGVGKTTLVNSIIGVTRWRGGSISLAGRDITRLAPEERAHAGIGWVPQERNIFRSLTVEENLTAVALPGPWTPARVFEMFPRLAERKTNMGNQLSGGEQQMLAIGRALVLNPKVLLLDEPTEGLAPIIVEELLKALTRLFREEGLAGIVIEQHARKILEITDDALVLERGRVVLSAPSAELIAHPDRLERHLGLGAAH